MKYKKSLDDNEKNILAIITALPQKYRKKEVVDALKFLFYNVGADIALLVDKLEATGDNMQKLSGKSAEKLYRVTSSTARKIYDSLESNVKDKLLEKLFYKSAHLFKEYALNISQAIRKNTSETSDRMSKFDSNLERILNSYHENTLGFSGS
ncbi:hypothetical protein HZA33_03980 [Candidatus Pacearchaeota archaeon]|nr:hypothetical protein [Candidatus Pacearchaeota archaeon]